MDNQTNDELNRWCEHARYEAMVSRESGGFNFIEITNLPKKIDGRSLTSLIVSASRIVPIATDVCIKKDSYGSMEQVALVEFKSEQDAFKAVDKVKSSAYGKTWEMKFMRDPRFANPESDMMDQWMR